MRSAVVFTVTEKVHVELPHELLAVHVTVVVPAPKKDPDAGVQVTVGVGLPVAVGVVYVGLKSLHVTIFEGHAPITGESLIVTLKLQLDDPHEFVAVHVTIVVPDANVEPDAGTQVTVAAGDPVDVGSVQLAM